MNFTAEYTFSKTIFVTDVKDEAEARLKSKAFLLNLLNQIEGSMELVDSWMTVKITKVGEINVSK